MTLQELKAAIQELEETYNVGPSTEVVVNDSEVGPSSVTQLELSVTTAEKGTTGNIIRIIIHSEESE